MTSDADGQIHSSRRVNDYLKYRPGYPDRIATALRHRIGYTSEFVVADVGSGTGISSAFFLERGNAVYAIEPNPDMRRVAEEWLRGYSKFRSVAARAEATTLEPASVDLVVAAHSFHWFDSDQARAEFERILRPGCFVALLWNERISEGTPFLVDYERLLYEYSDTYSGASRYPRIAEESLEHFFGPELRGTEEFSNQVPVDFEGLTGRTFAALPSSQQRHSAILASLSDLFEKHAEYGRVSFEYATRLVWGRLSRG